MANYFEMSKDQLRAEKAALEQSYAEFKAKGLKLNMARGKPGPHQMDLAMDLLKMSDYTTEDGYDARNYGNLEGLEEARALFGDVMGVKSSEVFVGGFIFIKWRCKNLSTDNCTNFFFANHYVNGKIYKP